MKIDESMREGHYARKQIFCRDWLISWSHRRRFEVGLKLADQLAGKAILDYGCGDGTFLSLLMSLPNPPASAVGAELDPSVVADCRRRFAAQGNLTFLLADELDQPGHDGRYDAIVCMEVLEHVVEVDAMLDRFVRLLAPGGSLLVSVPVETGLPLLLKQSARRVAGWRGLGDYPGVNPYSWRDLWTGVFAGATQHLPRAIHGSPGGVPFHDHKGFNWRVMQAKLSERFQLAPVISSPLTWLPPQLASQVWLVARKPA